MAREGEFAAWGEDPKSVVRAGILRRQVERCLRQVCPSCHSLHLVGRQFLGVEDHGDGVPLQGGRRDDIDDLICALHFDSPSLTGCRHGRPLSMRDRSRAAPGKPDGSEQGDVHRSSPRPDPTSAERAEAMLCCKAAHSRRSLSNTSTRVTITDRPARSTIPSAVRNGSAAGRRKLILYRVSARVGILRDHGHGRIAARRVAEGTDRGAVKEAVLLRHGSSNGISIVQRPVRALQYVRPRFAGIPDARSWQECGDCWPSP